MNNKNQKRNFSFSLVLILLSIFFTILVKVVDVKMIGPNNSLVGFSTLNSFIFNTIGFNMFWYKASEILGVVPLLLVFLYALYGFIQLLKRKNILKVDKEILFLGLYYMIVMGLYVFFEHFIINYRPVLLDGILEASYPSTHTLLSIFVCGSSIIVNKRLFSGKKINILNILLFVILLLTVITRLISGVHWFTDIIGGIIISSALLMSFYFLSGVIKK